MFELLLLGLVGSLVGGLITAGVNNNMAQQREEQARAENYRYNEMAAQMSDQRTRALYTDLQSPEAITGNQMQAIEKYGLSKSLLYSGGVTGGGGVSQSPMAGINGISPSVFGAPAPSAADIANTKLLNAQAEKTEAEAENIKKRNVTEQERGEAELQNLLTEKGLKDAQKRFTESQTSYTEIQNKIANATSEHQIRMAIYEANKMQYEEVRTMWEAENAKIDAETKNKIQESVVQESINRAANILVDTQLKQSQAKLTKEQIENLKAETKAVLQNAATNAKNAETSARQADNAAEANKIRRTELNKNIEMFNNEMKLKWQQYNLQETDITYKYAEDVVIHFGNMYSPITMDSKSKSDKSADKIRENIKK